MPASPGSRDSTRFVSLFQKAHGNIASLQRVDDQIATLFEQRRKILDDLRGVQSQINDEFNRMLELGRVIPADALMHEPANDNGNGSNAAKAAAREPKLLGAPRPGLTEASQNSDRPPRSATPPVEAPAVPA